MSSGVQYLQSPPVTVWLLFDIDNGNHPGKNYLRWFTSLTEAQEYRLKQMSIPNAARLSKPVKYELADVLSWP